jgi:thioredoxin 1
MSEEYTVLTTRDQLKQFVKANKVVIVKFKAEWCGPCKRIDPLFNNLMNQYKNIAYAVVDVDDGSGIASYLRIRSIPTMVSYLDGDVNDILSSSSENDIKAFVSKANTLF